MFGRKSVLSLSVKYDFVSMKHCSSNCSDLIQWKEYSGWNLFCHYYTVSEINILNVDPNMQKLNENYCLVNIDVSNENYVDCHV